MTVNNLQRRLTDTLPPVKAGLSVWLLAVCLISSVWAANGKIISGTININTAAAVELMYLPGIGKKRSASIIESRRQQPFSSTRELVSRKLLSTNAFQKIAAFLTVRGDSRYVLQGGKKSGIQPNILDRPGIFDNPIPAVVHLLPDSAFADALRAQIALSRHQVFLGTYVFVLTGSKHNAAGRLIDLLAERVKAGVTITVFLEKSARNRSVNGTNLEAAEALQAAGVHVVFDAPENTFHAKLAVIDDRWVFIGSHNITHSALTKNKEFSVMIDSPSAALEVTDYLKRLTP